LNNFALFLTIIYSIFGIGICIGYFFEFKKEKKWLNSTNDKIDLQKLIVLIPFRNEEFRIKQLIQDINLLKITPKKFIFIDDHSNDSTVVEIKKLKTSILYEILYLPNELEGKKHAIRFGIQHEESDYNLTWDADISIAPEYFQHIQQLPESVLIILPVKMTGTTLKELFFEFDHSFANAINTSVAGLKRPFLASGANLLFNQKIFIKNDSFSSHKQFASGDDMYLLRDFRNEKQEIHLISSENFAVSTQTPTTWKDFFKQRLRWIGKGKDINDQLSNGLALTSLLFNCSFHSLFFYLLVTLRIQELVFYFSIKTLLDLSVYSIYCNRIKRFSTTALLPFFSIIQPVYILLLTLLLFLYKPKWKNREIYSK